jgi:hypothetical protein
MAKLTEPELEEIRQENLENINKYSTHKVAEMYINTIFNV